MPKRKKSGNKQSSNCRKTEPAQIEKRETARDLIGQIHSTISKYPNSEDDKNNIEQIGLENNNITSSSTNENKFQPYDGKWFSDGLKETKTDLRQRITAEATSLRNEIGGIKEIIKSDIDARISKLETKFFVWAVGILVLITSSLITLNNCQENKLAEQIQKDTKYAIDERFQKLEYNHNNRSIDTLQVIPPQ